MKIMIPYQLDLCQELPSITGSIDFTNYQELIFEIDKIIEETKLEELVSAYNITRKEKIRFEQKKRKLSEKEKINIQKTSIIALRCTLLRSLTGYSLRIFSFRLGDSILFRYFCRLNTFGTLNKNGKIVIPGKSVLERYEKMIPEEKIRELNNQLLTELMNKLGKEQMFETVYYDSTCVEANIHFPVDWILMRDAIKTLMQSIELIRKAGLKNRMDEPEFFIKKINRLCIEMSNTRKKKNAKKMRKAIFRKMKKIVAAVKKHAERHRLLLEKHSDFTKLSKKQTSQIIKRIDNVLEKLPAAVKQAHERIIGERKVPSKEKILSFYEPDINVIVRGKASAEVEYGNKLIIGELENGMIIDWELCGKGVPSDNELMEKSLERINKNYSKNSRPNSIVGDRGFSSSKSKKYLEKNNYNDYICPRSVKELEEKLLDDIFKEKQNRRSQTEGRISIIKNLFLRKPFRSKGFENRKLLLAVKILVHNLWVAARLEKYENKTQEIIA